jgi:glycosyltransferase involved in cell wall biosynthesis
MPMHFSINGRFLTQPITGVQRYAIELTNALDRILDEHKDIKITVWSPRLRAERPRWRNLLLREEGRLHGNLWEQFELPFLCRNELLFCPGNTSPIACLLRKQPVLTVIHDLSYLHFPAAYSWRFRLWYNIVVPMAMKFAKSLLTVSETERKSIVRHFPEVASKIWAIPNGGWPGDNPPDTSWHPDNQKPILYVGSLSKRKNFPALLEAAIALSRRRGLRFRFVGGIERSLASPDTSVPPDVGQLIKFEGATNDVNLLARYYSEAAMFVFPSLYESSALPPAEAMAFGCPVIVSDIPALRERCAEAALYCETSTQGIIDAIESLVDSQELQLKFSQLGRQHVRAITWGACAKSTLDVIRETIGPGN